MGQAIAVHREFTSAELRRLATRTRDVAQAISPGRSCPSPNANGPSSVGHSNDWY